MRQGKGYIGKVKIGNGNSTPGMTRFCLWQQPWRYEEKRTGLIFIQKTKSAELGDKWNVGCKKDGVGDGIPGVLFWFFVLFSFQFLRSSSNYLGMDQGLDPGDLPH